MATKKEKENWFSSFFKDEIVWHKQCNILICHHFPLRIQVNAHLWTPPGCIVHHLAWTLQPPGGILELLNVISKITINRNHGGIKVWAIIASNLQEVPKIYHYYLLWAFDLLSLGNTLFLWWIVVIFVNIVKSDGSVDWPCGLRCNYPSKLLMSQCSMAKIR